MNRYSCQVVKLRRSLKVKETAGHKGNGNVQEGFGFAKLN